MRDPEFQDNSENYRYSESRRTRKPEVNIWQRMSRFMEVIVVILLILGFAKLFSPEIQKQKELQAELKRLKAIKFEKSARANRLRKEHAHLISDRAYMESVARDRLNLQREGEYVIRIER